MKRNEHTSARLASIAGRILAVKAIGRATIQLSDHGVPYKATFKWSDIRALAASALTQAQDHAERETIRKGKLPKGHRKIKVPKPILRNGKARKAAQLRGKRK
jgi:hypothetical protein